MEKWQNGLDWEIVTYNTENDGRLGTPPTQKQPLARNSLSEEGGEFFFQVYRSDR